MKKNVFIIICLVIIAWLIYSSSNDKRVREGNIKALTEEMDLYKTKYNEVVASKQSVIITNDFLKSSNDSLKQIIKNFKKPDIVVKYKWKLKVDTLYVPLISTEYPDEFKFNYSDQWASLSGKVNKKDIVFDPPILINEQDVVSGIKKKGLFGKKEYYVDIKNSNPYIQHVSINTFKVDVRKSWHEKWWITIPIGFTAGYLTGR